MADIETPEAQNPLVKDIPESHTVHRNASWGAVISIVIILAMVIIGAFYSWGQRISEEKSAQNQVPASNQ